MTLITLTFTASAWAEEARDCSDAPPLDYAGCKYDKGGMASTVYLRGMLVNNQKYDKETNLLSMSQSRQSKEEASREIEHCLVIFREKLKKLVAEGKCKEQDESVIRKLSEFETDLKNDGYFLPSPEGEAKSLAGTGNGRARKN